MKRILFIAAAFSWLSCSAQQTVDNREREIVFRNVSVIPMDKNEVLQNRDVVVSKGIIKSIFETASQEYGKDALVIDAKGKFLMPGLAEMHAHVPPVEDITPMNEVLMLFALNGVTTIRGMLGHPLHLVLRQKIQT